MLLRPKNKKNARSDPLFPWLEEGDRFDFPPFSRANGDGLLCTGGNLSPGMLLSAYNQGVFPWFSEDSPLLWWSPDPRFVLEPAELHVSATMRKFLCKRHFTLKLDTAFGDVIRACSMVSRPGQSGTWICGDMIAAYENLHRLGYAHSIEAWEGDKLVGGLYGISLGSIFFGESMFSLVPDASKAAFIPFIWKLLDEGFTLIDSQVHTNHVEALGGKHISRIEYCSRLAESLKAPSQKGNWGDLWPDFPVSRLWRSVVLKE